MYEKVKSHEQSTIHIANYVKWKDLEVALERQSGIDGRYQKKVSEEKQRWREILRCLLEVTLFLAERNLPFRGSSSLIGDQNNGNFLGTLELLSSYSPLVREHVCKVMHYQQKGERLQAHYLSWQIQNEFIALCAKQVHEAICFELQQAYYFGLIVNGTPDVSHTEQLTFVLRYALLKDRNWEVVERFLTLHDCEKKKGKDIAKAICDVLEMNQIDINRC